MNRTFLAIGGPFLLIGVLLSATGNATTGWVFVTLGTVFITLGLVLDQQRGRAAETPEAPDAPETPEAPDGR